MSEEEQAPATSDRPGLRRTARLEAFSDGVFAIAITLLVLDLAVPENKQSVQDLLGAIGDVVAVIGYLAIALFLLLPLRIHRLWRPGRRQLHPDRLMTRYRGSG